VIHLCYLSNLPAVGVWRLQVLTKLPIHIRGFEQITDWLKTFDVVSNSNSKYLASNLTTYYLSQFSTIIKRATISPHHFYSTLLMCSAKKNGLKVWFLSISYYKISDLDQFFFFIYRNTIYYTFTPPPPLFFF
jgi:hypothetical protein